MSELEKNIMNLNSISNTGTSKNRKRVGRGIGSGNGKTAGRGHKGQKSRSGGNVRIGFEGGQMPLQMRLPKFGFSSRVNNAFKGVNVKNINGMKEVTIEILKAEKIIGKYVNKVKIFGNTELDSKVVVKGINVTKGAKKSIEDAGGKIIETISTEENKQTKEETK